MANFERDFLLLLSIDLCMSASTFIIASVYTQLWPIKITMFAERQEERLKTNNRDLSMASDAVAVRSVI